MLTLFWGKVLVAKSVNLWGFFKDKTFYAIGFGKFVIAFGRNGNKLFCGEGYL